MRLFEDTGMNQLATAVLMLAGSVFVIAMVLGFQHIGGYIPCKLCYGQREPFYTAIPIAALATLAAWQKWPGCITRGLLAVLGLLMIYSIMLASHHAGVEWDWWAGPTDCGATTGNLSGDIGNLMKDLTAKKPPACDEAAVRFLGLSFAGWNVIASIGLALIALRGAFARP